MEQIIEQTTELTLIHLPQVEEVSHVKPFIEANTIVASLEEISEEHIIPVFVKDNEPLISQAEFIGITMSLADDIFQGEKILQPNIRVSHPIKGRVPGAKDKPANQLLEWEKTLYYERMAFIIEIPTIQDDIDGNQLSLTIGGVKAYNTDSLYSRSSSVQHFKIFIGFKNRVCTNLCVWTDGYMDDVSVMNAGQLKAAIRTLLESYNRYYHLYNLRKLTEYSISETQFAQIIGKCRMYHHLPPKIKTDIPALLFGDQQVGTVVKDFYRDDSFCRNSDGNMNLWKLYNLFTGANKSTYIDNFLERSVNAFNLIEQIRYGLEKKQTCWYLQ